MSMRKCQWNEFVIFVNKFKKDNPGQSEYFGQASLEGQFVYLYADLFRGDKIVYMKGRVFTKFPKKEVGHFTLFPAYCKTPFAPNFKGWLKMGLHIDYEMAVWVKESNNNVKFMQGKLTIKDPESLYKEEALAKTYAPKEMDYNIF